MDDKYVCQDCNYSSHDSGECPHCSMPLEAVGAKGVDDITGEPTKYATEELESVEKNTADDVKYSKAPKKPDTTEKDDEFDDRIDDEDEDEKFLKKTQEENEKDEKK